MKRLLAFVFIALLFLSAIYAEINVISPIEGEWANKQMLVIDTSNLEDDCEFFYSINGADPATFGFAYDGPVILDVEGSVILRIAHVHTTSEKQEQTEIHYTVNSDYGYDTNYYEFLGQFMDTGIVYYNSGSVFTIPSELLYNLNNSDALFSNGTDLKLHEDNLISRYIPVTLLDNSKKILYHFVMKTMAQNAGIFSHRDVPFVIEDWETLCFTDDNLLYKIDSEYWHLPKEPRILDRTVSHMISWQSLNFEVGNPVEFFIIPPKPQLLEEKMDNGAIVYSLNAPEEDNYTMSIRSNQNEYRELFQKIGVDAFEGDKIQGQLEIDIYSNSVYQGTEIKEYSINKGPIAKPKITSSAKDFYSHKKVTVCIEGDSNDNCSLYVAVCEPLLINDSTEEIKPDNDIFNYDTKIDFTKADDNKYYADLISVGEGAVYYKVLAYSSNGEKSSLLAEYSVVVDEYNYYFDLAANPETQDGTIKNPFTSFEKCLESVNENRSVCIHILGNMTIPEGKNFLTANCEIKTKPSSVIIFEPGASLIVQNASLDIENARIQNSSSAEFKNVVPLIKLENSVLHLTDCLISAEFSKNGTVIDSVNSVVDIKKCIVSTNALTYASFISCMNSKLNIEKSMINSSADTSLIISDNDGIINLFDNSFKLSGRTGRIAEFFGSSASSNNNNFKANFINNGNSVSPIYVNKTAKLKQSNNEYSGF